MLKKILCVMTVLAVMLACLGGCGKPVETVEVPKADSLAHFAAYKEDIVAILDKSKADYELSEAFAGNEEDAPEDAAYFYIMKITLKEEAGTEINISLTNEDKIESFSVSLLVSKPTIEDCDLNIRDYPYVRKIFNLVSEINVSAFSGNRLLRSTRKGSKQQYEGNPDAFYKKQEKFFTRDKTETWVLQYAIYYNTTTHPTVFEETLTFKGHVAPRTVA
ncbi:MAG TPA: hypothetical protein VFD23_00885 [Clostridia bacterium]|nr:hypothetical protein [Clostridia bacterium]